MLPPPAVGYGQGIAGLDCWIAQSGLQSNLVDWIVIQSQNWILDLDCQSSFAISIQIQSIKLFYHDIKIS